MINLTEDQHEALRSRCFASNEAVERFLEVHGWLSRLRYKPNFTFTLETRQVSSPTSTRPLDDLLLRIDMLVPDSYHPEQTVPITMIQVVPTFISFFEEFVDWMRSLLGHMEMHERDEWILVDGERKFDPHQRRSER